MDRWWTSRDHLAECGGLQNPIFLDVLSELAQRTPCCSHSRFRCLGAIQTAKTRVRAAWRPPGQLDKTSRITVFCNPLPSARWSRIVHHVSRLLVGHAKRYAYRGFGGLPLSGMSKTSRIMVFRTSITTAVIRKHCNPRLKTFFNLGHMTRTTKKHGVAVAVCLQSRILCGLARGL